MGKTMSDDEADDMLLNNSWAKFSDARNLLQEAYEVGWDRRQSEVYQLTSQRDVLLESLRSIVDCCNEEHAARDYASRQTEIRGIALAGIKAVEENT